MYGNQPGSKLDGVLMVIGGILLFILMMSQA